MLYQDSRRRRFGINRNCCLTLSDELADSLLDTKAASPES